MKNFFKNSAILAMGLGMAVVATSCHNESYEGSAENKITADVQTINTLQVNVNQPAATVVYGSKVLSGTGNQFVLEGAASTGVLKVSKAGYLDQTIDIDFGDRSIVVVDVELVSAPTPVTPAVAATTDVTNSDTNKEETKNDEGEVVEATMYTTQSTVSSGDDTPGYSITVFTPAVSDCEYPEEGSEYSSDEESNGTVAPYALDCQPSGVTFAGAGIPVEIKIPGVTGLELEVVDENGVSANDVNLTGEKLTANLPHFSVWDIVLKASVSSVDSVQVEVASGSLAAGKNLVSFNERYGFTAPDVKAKSIIFKFLKCVFGTSLTTISKTTSIETPSVGSYKIYQQEFTYTFICGNQTFKAKAYGKPTVDVTYTKESEEEPIVVPTHGGGTND